MDEDEATPTLRVALGTDESGVRLIAITSHHGDGASDTHGTMALELRTEEAASHLDVAAASAEGSSSGERVAAAAFYLACGNDYQGEFRAMEWATAIKPNGGEILSKVSYPHTEVHRVHLRSCAWLDTCLHAPYWWAEHRSRPFYIASVRSYWIRSMDASRNRTMWSLMQGLGGQGDLQPDVLRYHSDEGRRRDGSQQEARCRVQIDGSRLGFFEVGWLERRRVHRHLYRVDWAAVAEPEQASQRPAAARQPSNKRPAVVNALVAPATWAIDATKAHCGRSAIRAPLPLLGSGGGACVLLVAAA